MPEIIKKNVMKLSKLFLVLPNIKKNKLSAAIAQQTFLANPSFFLSMYVTIISKTKRSSCVKAYLILYKIHALGSREARL